MASPHIAPIPNDRQEMLEKEPPHLETSRLNSETSPTVQNANKNEEYYGELMASRPRGLSALKIVKIWYIEILCALAAIGFMVAVYCLLAKHDGKRTSSWTFSMNLTTLVATCSTLNRMALVTTSSELISQAKWATFWGSRPTVDDGSSSKKRKKGIPLEDVEIFDEASRGGIPGTLRLIKRSLRRPALMLSLLVMLLSIAMGSFTQQAVRTIECKYPLDDDNNSSATIPNIQTLGDLRTSTTRTRGWSEDDRYWKTPLGYSVRAGVLASLAGPNDVDSAIQVACATGNCTFPSFPDSDGSLITHRSVGLCGSCIDATSYVFHNESHTTPKRGWSTTLSSDTVSWFLPNGQEIYQEIDLVHSEGAGYASDYNTAFMNIASNLPLAFLVDHQSSENEEEVARFLNISRYALTNFTLMSMDGLIPSSSSDEQQPVMEPNNPNISATACTIYPCVRSYHASVSKGQLTESVVSSSPGGGEPMRPYGDVLPNWTYKQQISSGEKIIFPSDDISILTPCLVGGGGGRAGIYYTSENISSAPTDTAVSLTRNDLGTTTPAFVDWADGNNSGIEVNLTAPPECIFALDHYNWGSSMGDFLAGAFGGTCGTWGENGDTESCVSSSTTTTGEGGGSGNGGTMAPFWLDVLANMPNRSHVHTTRYLDDVVESLTRKLRSGFGNYSALETWPVGRVGGVAWETTTCFEVEWGWLVLPTGLTVMGVAALFWTLFKGIVVRGDGGGPREWMMWKSAVLPLLYHQNRFVVVDEGGGAASIFGAEEEKVERRGGGGDMGGREERTPLMDLNDMRRDARHVRVVFQG